MLREFNRSPGGVPDHDGNQGERLMKEGDILKQCRDYLRYRGWFVIRIQQGLGCHKGISDLICVKNGKVLFLEIKATGGKLSPHQVKFCADVRGHGGIYIWVCSFDELKNIIDY